MSQDIYQLLQSMQYYLHQQDQKILHLQNKIQSLEKKITEIHKRPPVHIEKMEYKFDQLKVETLEGTLNIGLNPSDLQDIEDLSLPNQNSSFAPKERMTLFTEIETSIDEYLDKNLPKVIQDTAQSLQFQHDGTFDEFIRNDIKKQLPNRIEYYLNEPNREPQPSLEQKKSWILEQLKKEIHYGVLTFLQNLPENMKGSKSE